MSLNTIISTTLGFFTGLSKKKLVGIMDQLRKSYKKAIQENEQLKEEIAKLQETLKTKEAKIVDLTIREVNKIAISQAQSKQNGNKKG